MNDNRAQQQHRPRLSAPNLPAKLAVSSLQDMVDALPSPRSYRWGQRVSWQPRCESSVLKVLVIAILLGLTSACGAKSADGHLCLASAECQHGLCMVNQCLDPAADSDHDGLTNAQEHVLHSHPLRADTDGDSKPDGLEVGADPQHPLDSDGDGLADVLESALIDSDGDCLVDELDPRNTVPDATPAELAKAACAKAGVCAGAAAIVATCTSAALHCDYSAVTHFSQQEFCDGLDNNCDGDTDEGFGYGGFAVGKTCIGTGACGSGIVECRNGAAVCSSNPDGSATAAKPEVCNGLDDDCNGQTDEGFSLSGLPIGAPCQGNGQCGLGTVVCVKGQALCSSNPGGPASTATPEVCNGKDDDCDGITDDGIALGGLPLGASCVSAGICGAGKVVCGAEDQAVCSSAPGNPGSAASAELCNGIDDNCDGKTDEGFQFQGITLGLPCPARGQCGPGVVSCNSLGATTCSTYADGPASQAKPEVCNGVDDDCDGATDNGQLFQGVAVGGACKGTGECGVGTVTCNSAGKAACSSNPDGGQGQGKAEICNGLDDDCDGVTDQGATPPVQMACPTTGVCLTQAAAILCTAGQWTCDFSAASAWQATETTCDSLDNDCDGVTDEGLPHTFSTALPLADGRPPALNWPAFAQGNDALYLVGGWQTTLGAGNSTLSAGLWRLDLSNNTWKHMVNHPLLQRQHAALVYLPAGAVAAGARLWILGGQDANNQEMPAASFDFVTGQVSNLPVSPQPRSDPSAVWQPLTQELWLLGGSIGDGAAQRYDITNGTWSAAVPQPSPTTSGGAACAAADGAVYAVLGTPAAIAWKPPAMTWKYGTAPQNLGSAVGTRLVCDAAPGEVWLIGARDDMGKFQPPLRYLTKSDSWIAASDPTWPPLRTMGVAQTVQGLVVAGGMGTDSNPQLHWYSGTIGQFKLADSSPEPTIGSRWLGVGDDVIRFGGAVLRGTLVDCDVPAWRLHAGVWQRLPLPDGISGRAFGQVILDSGETAALFWGGSTKWAPAQSLLVSEVMSATSGGARLDLTTWQWSNLAGSPGSWLPTLKVDASTAPGVAAGQWYAFASGPTMPQATLWHLDTVQKSSSEIWTSSQSVGPAFRPGSALFRDTPNNRLLLAVDDGQIEIWAWPLTGGGAWQLLSQVPMPGTNRVWVGDSGSANQRLVIVTPSPGMGASTFLDLQLGAMLTVLPLPITVPWLGPVDGIWQNGSTRLLISGRLDAAGAIVAGQEQIQWQCK